MKCFYSFLSPSCWEKSVGTCEGARGGSLPSTWRRDERAVEDPLNTLADLLWCVGLMNGGRENTSCPLFSLLALSQEKRTWGGARDSKKSKIPVYKTLQTSPTTSHNRRRPSSGERKSHRSRIKRPRCTSDALSTVTSFRERLQERFAAHRDSRRRRTNKKITITTTTLLCETR